MYVVILGPSRSLKTRSRKFLESKAVRGIVGLSDLECRGTQCYKKVKVHEGHLGQLVKGKQRVQWVPSGPRYIPQKVNGAKGAEGWRQRDIIVHMGHMGLWGKGCKGDSGS